MQDLTNFAEFVGFHGIYVQIRPSRQEIGVAKEQRQVQWSYAADWNDAEWNGQFWPEEHQDNAQWTAAPRRRQTPRRRPSRKAKKQDVQTPVTHKGKGKGVNLDTEGFGPPTLPQNVTEPPWLAAMNTLATAAPPPSQAAPEDRQLRTILAALKKHNDVLPPELQNMVNDAAIKEGQQQTKQLHAVVTAHGKARKELQQAQLARYDLHNAWRSFLSQAVTQWQGYSAQFMEQEKQMNERVTAAQTALEQAKENLATAKASAGIESKDDTMNVSDEEQDKDLTGTASHRIQEGLTSLQTNLEALQQSATQMLEDEQKALKRPRIEEKPDHGTKPSEPSSTVPGLVRPSKYYPGKYCSMAYAA